ncbi:unnamed protein product [Durusdinium trenchii]|uniref:Uncharacterized protein n=1 Tax=Durusdinium trenchii TaxID=1381693 RepID=A0ABP0QD07_9DINO
MASSPRSSRTSWKVWTPSPGATSPSSVFYTLLSSGHTLDSSMTSRPSDGADPDPK